MFVYRIGYSYTGWGVCIQDWDVCIQDGVFVYRIAC